MEELYLTLNDHGFMFCYDIGHNVIYNNYLYESWRKKLNLFVRHMHMHNVYNKKDHQELSRGELYIPDFIEYAQKDNIDIVIEVKDLLNLKKSVEFYKKYNPNVFVIGGSELYNTFLNQADRLYITQVQTEDGKDVKFIEGEEPDIFMNHFTSDYQLIGMSEKYKGKYKDILLSYRVLHYRLSEKMSEEYKYLNFMNNILSNGNERSDRTGTGTMSLFGNQMRFDISQSIPLMTTKRMPFKTIVEELLWFCRFQFCGGFNVRHIDNRFCITDITLNRTVHVRL